MKSFAKSCTERARQGPCPNTLFAPLVCPLGVCQAACPPTANPSIVFYIEGVNTFRGRSRAVPWLAWPTGSESRAVRPWAKSSHFIRVSPSGAVAIVGTFRSPASFHLFIQISCIKTTPSTPQPGFVRHTRRFSTFVLFSQVHRVHSALFRSPLTEAKFYFPHLLMQLCYEDFPD